MTDYTNYAIKSDLIIVILLQRLIREMLDLVHKLNLVVARTKTEYQVKFCDSTKY